MNEPIHPAITGRWLFLRSILNAPSNAVMIAASNGSNGIRIIKVRGVNMFFFGGCWCTGFSLRQRICAQASACTSHFKFSLFNSQFNFFNPPGARSLRLEATATTVRGRRLKPVHQLNFAAVS